MGRIGRILLGILAGLPPVSSGCVLTSTPNDVPVHANPAAALPAARPGGTAPPAPIRLASPATPSPQLPHADSGRTPFDRGELTAEDVVRVVLERNPTLEQMVAAAAAVAARYPQVTSLDDPMLGFQTAPFSAGSPHADYAARVEVSQKLPLFGKRGLRGQVVLAEASAATADVGDARLQLAEASRSALADYFLAVRSLGVAEENLTLLREFRQNAETRYKTGLAPQQDILQSDVELARLEERVVSLTRGRQVARARINTLAHLPPDSPLPLPADFGPPGPLGDAADLRARAVANRPDLKALSDRLAADAATLSLADREYRPDVELLTAYDGFWQGDGGRPLQWQVGARVNLPLRLGRRDGAVAEARAKVAQRRAEIARLTDQIGLQVQEAFEQVSESVQVVKLYETKALPAAAANVKEAQSAYVTGKVPFLSLVEAQRNAIAVRDRLNEARAEAFRRRAVLDRAVGEPVPASGPLSGR